ncbi:MAG TPA: efflux RND transporter periplasmic adaptor subunit [Candidatus Polarisedimenticolia bacterium]|nr:efflux RND transporter periplasmic adaptor subunit [Candidatus Polarisedimenticolia bacterium]
MARRRGLGARGKILSAAGVAGVLALAALSPAIGRWARAEKAVDLARLRVGAVSRGDLLRDLSVQGTIVAAFHPRLFSPAQGIVQVMTRAGEVVSKGQLLALVDSPELTSRLEQEQATLLALRSDLARDEIAGRQARIQNAQNIELFEVRHAAAGRDLERSQRLFDEGLLNKTDYEKARDVVTVATLELQNARRSAELAAETLEVELHNRRLQIERQESVVREQQRRVGQLRIIAPFDGMVATLDVDDRDAVAVNQPLLTVVDLSTYEVELSIPENYADDVEPGTPVVIHFQGREYPGQVTAISPEVRESEVEGRAVFSGQAPAGLKQNQRVSTRIVLDARSNVLKVPRGPFLESGGGHKAYVLKEGLALLRPIEVGAVSVSEVEIVNGLEEGEEIILSDMAPFEGAATVLVRP